MPVAAAMAATLALVVQTGSFVQLRPRCAPLRMQEAQETLKCDVRKIPKSAIALDIIVPKQVAHDIHLKTLAKLAKGSEMPGFRQGKVPPQAVIAKLGMQKVKEATVEQIIDVGMQQSGVGQRVHTGTPQLARTRARPRASTLPAPAPAASCASASA
jgi:hypothetical protein